MTGGTFSMDIVVSKASAMDNAVSKASAMDNVLSKASALDDGALKAPAMDDVALKAPALDGDVILDAPGSPTTATTSTRVILYSDYLVCTA